MKVVRAASVEVGIQSSWMCVSVTIRTFACEIAFGLITCTDHSEYGPNCAPVGCYREHHAHTTRCHCKKKDVFDLQRLMQ